MQGAQPERDVYLEGMSKVRGDVWSEGMHTKNKKYNNVC